MNMTKLMNLKNDILDHQTNRAPVGWGLKLIDAKDT